jgi:hypothetical protein
MAGISDIQAYAASLQTQLTASIATLLDWRPTTFTVADPADFTPDLVKLGFSGSAPAAPVPDSAPVAPILAQGNITPIAPLLPEGFGKDFTGRDLTAPVSLTPQTFDTPSVDFGKAPDSPILAFISEPTLTNVPIPPPLTLAGLPVFTAAMPSADNFPDLPFKDNPLSGFNITQFKRQVYESPVLDQVGKVLLDDITNGRTGVPAAVEDDIWKRQAERDLIALGDSLKLAADTFSKQCFSLAPGRLDRKRSELITNYTFTRNDRSREISQKQAEITQTNRQFAITTAVEIEKQQMQFAMQFAAFTLDVAKETVNAGIAIYNAYLARYTALLEGYKTETQVFEARLRAFSTQIEIYKGELEAARITGELNVQQIEIYKAKIAAQEQLVRIYTAKVEGYTASANVEKLKIDVFKAQIEGYQAEIQAKVAEYGGYEAQLRGETARVQGFEAEVQAYKAKTEGTTEYNRALSVGVDAQAKVVQAQAENNRIQIMEYEGKLSQMRFTNEFKMEAFKAEIETFFSQLKVALANADVNKFNIDTSLKRWETLQSTITSRANIMVNEIQSENTIKEHALISSISAIQTIMNTLAAINIDITKH